MRLAERASSPKKLEMTSFTIFGLGWKSDG